MRVLCFLPLLVAAGCADPATLLEDRPLGPKIHFSTIHYAEGKEHPRQLVIRGTLDGPGQLGLDPNHLTLDSDGTIVATTLLGYTPIAVQIKPVDTPDPDKDKKGRKVYDIVPVKESYAQVLPGAVAQRGRAASLADPRVTKTSARIHWWTRIERSIRRRPRAREGVTRGTEGHRGTPQDPRLRLPLPNGNEGRGDVSLLPEWRRRPQQNRPGTAGLKNLGFLSFNGVKLPPEGLKCISSTPSLKTLDFTDSEIDDAGLACVKDATQLKVMSFFGSRGLSDKGMAHLQGLTNLVLLDLRNESFSAAEPKALRVTDAGLKHLAGCTKLEYLNLQGQHITDEGLKHLSGMTNLQTLSLSFSGITDEGLKHLYGLQKLVNFT